ncbi:MAG: right-handed parallel beta-helix repeat-containing protein [bacterium]|nr:right-handed parallel beta-helix repeat-containing protein [bacterium]
MRIRPAILLSLLTLAVFSCAGPRSAILRGTVDQPVVLADAVTADTTLSGMVTISEDLLVPEGITLAFQPGTRVTVLSSEGTRTDSQFVTTGTEIVVRGVLVLEDTVIRTETGTRGSWGGIVAATPGAAVTLERSTVAGAQYGLMMLGGTARVTGCTFTGNEVGMAAALGAWVIQSGNTYRDNGIATAAWHTLNPLKSPSDTFEGNGDGALSLTAQPVDVHYRETLPVTPDRPPVTRQYMGEVALTEDTTWSGTVIIDGQVAVPPEVTLEIGPGTHVLFTFRDTNGDGLGESWIVVQGTVKVLGEEDAWVLFDSEEPGASPGVWDSLSVIASDSPDNVVNNAIFRHGVKAFHSHFSKARFSNVIFEDNLRGVQFQESAGTVIDRAFFRRNQSGARFRDSEVTLTNIVAEDNVAGINFLRSKVAVSDLVVTGSFAESFVSRESETTLTRAVISGNVRGPRFKGAGEKVTIRESMVRGNLTEGLSFNSVDGRVIYSDLSQNGFTGLSVTDAPVRVEMSRLAGNGRFDVDNNGSTGIDASGCDWGVGGPPDPARIYDGQDEEGIGSVITDEPLTFSLAFPGTGVPTGPYAGRLLIAGDVPTPTDKPVSLRHGARIWFSPVEADSLFDLCSDHPGFPSSELIVSGRIDAVGTANEPIHFSQAGLASVEGVKWGSVNLLNGKGGRFENCVFTNASTGIHAREAGDVVVRDCAFERNDVGLRFSSTNMSVRGNAFRYNDAGLRFHEFGGTVEGNTFEGNNTAIFVTDNPENVALKNNTFSESRDYHVKLGIHVTEDVEVEGGAFDLPKGKVLGDVIFDKEDDGDLGRVVIVP